MQTLVGSAAGGITVETELTCYGEAMAQVVTPNVRQGPKGTAAEFSARQVGEVKRQDPVDGWHQNCSKLSESSPI